MNDWVVSQKEELRADFLKLVLYELNASVSPKEKRIKSLRAAIDEFNHFDTNKHDQELELQADKILFQKLSYCFTVHKHDEEIGLVACALEMVYRANRARVALSFQEIGDSILPLFLEMIRWSSARRKDIWAQNEIGDGANGTGGNQNSVVGDTSAAGGGHSSGESSVNSGRPSLISILKGDTETPVRSNRVRGKKVDFNSNDMNSMGMQDKNNNMNGTRPERIPDELPRSQQFTIECIPNGTETNSHVESCVIGLTNEMSAAGNDTPLKPTKLDKGEKDSCDVTDDSTSDDGSPPGASPPGFEPLISLPENPPPTSESGRLQSQSSTREKSVRFSGSVETRHLDASVSKLPPAIGDDGSSDIPTNSTSITSGSSGSNSFGMVVLPMRKEKFTHPQAVLKLLKILRYFSRVLSAMVPMAHFPGLLDEIIFQLKIRKSSEGILRSNSRRLDSSGRSMTMEDDISSSGSGKISDAESSGGGTLERNTSHSKRRRKYLDNASAARMDTIATVVNLACAEENKSKLLNHPGMLDAVVDVAENDDIPDAREHASMVVMNLALADENKLEMARRDNFLNCIMKLMTDEVVNCRRYASATILTLITPPNTGRLAAFGNGRLLHELTKVLAMDEIEEVRLNIAEGFFNLVRNSTEQETIELIGRHRDVLPALASSVISDYCADVRAYSARTLEWLAADIHQGSSSHGKMLDALINASMWTKTTCIVEALKAQASIEQNRASMVKRKGMLDTLANLASLHGVNDEEVRECALATIERLTCEPSTRKIMSMHEAVMMELTRATFSTSGILDEYEEDDKLTRSLMKAALKNLADAI